MLALRDQLKMYNERDEEELRRRNAKHRLHFLHREQQKLARQGEEHTERDEEELERRKAKHRLNFKNIIQLEREQKELARQDEDHLELHVRLAMNRRLLAADAGAGNA